MSFESREISNYGGTPVRLYDFSYGKTHWRYASHDSDLDCDVGLSKFQTFKSLAISDDGIKQSGDPTDDTLTVTMPLGEPLVNLFNGTPPAETIQLVIREVHLGEESDAPIVWIGFVSSRKIASLVEAQIACTPLLASFNRTGQRLAWGRGCPHALYDSECRIQKSTYARTLTITSLTGVTVIATGAASLPEGYLAGGFMEWSDQFGNVDRRGIQSHAGASFDVLGTTDGLSVGMVVTVYPGCNRTTEHCISRFNNLSNYGGFPHLPGKSPFDGSPVF